MIAHDDRWSREDGLWESDEFEEAVTRAIIGLYETENAPEKLKPPKGVRLRENILPTGDDIRRARQLGAYFPPGDRLVFPNWLDVEVDGVPAAASFASLGGPREGNFVTGTVEMLFAWRIPRLPRGWRVRCLNPLAYYRVLVWYPQPQGSSWMALEYGALDESGRTFAAYEPGRVPPPGENPRRAEEYQAHRLSFTLQYTADRRHLWNVEAIEHEAKAIFGVNEEQIKSLFYMREAPLTETGRRRPILHWVRSHRRRLKEGVDLDIRKHLRGCDGFEMNGTTFRITNPRRQSAP